MISVIVPVMNEAERIVKLIESLQGLRGEKEIIISDGGSTDGTMEKLRAIDTVKTVQAASGRGTQMNAGASLAKGNILWFVHADSVLSPSSLIDIENAVADGAIGGFFRLYFYDADDGFMRFIARTSHTRAKRFCLIFGDQGLFLRRDVFDGLGGFADIPLMEDWEISMRFRQFHRQGMIRALDTEIGTSARRYIENGRFKTWLKMNTVKALYILGVPAKILRRIYDGRTHNIFTASNRP